MYRVEQSENCNIVFLAGELTIYQAEASFNELVNWLNQDIPLIIDLEGVTDIDSSGIQILLMVNKERSTRGFAFSLVNHSKIVVNVFERVGLLALFNDPVLLVGSDEIASVKEKGGC
ncbi:STAS domain-containing protein [Shewanella sp. SM20]|uniref:STAS domain-containing protein n=1 Tax=Shewanella sp. SM20 TaxID=2912792 RepID=UPI0021D8BEF4|nr:STAS domain-containing protein [Shewanella sp. SM20]MCU8094123.1 STAS domain-containing protein [Shewanella sp. SM20]